MRLFSTCLAAALWTSTAVAAPASPADPSPAPQRPRTIEAVDFAGTAAFYGGWIGRC